MSILRVKNLDAGYGEVTVVRDFHIEVEEGEIVSLIGANGAGKSTAVNATAGWLPVKKGEVHFMGEDVTLLPAEIRCKLGLVLVPEGRRLFPLMTVEENLLIGAYNAREYLKRNLQFVLELFPKLKERFHFPAVSLSGGEQQMLAIARGLMANPKLLILDEPSLGLAPTLVQDLYRIIPKISSERGISILLVEQDVLKALRVSTRACLLENGSVVRFEESKKLLEDPHVKASYLGL